MLRFCSGPSSDTHLAWSERRSLHLLDLVLSPLQAHVILLSSSLLLLQPHELLTGSLNEPGRLAAASGPLCFVLLLPRMQSLFLLSCIFAVFLYMNISTWDCILLSPLLLTQKLAHCMLCSVSFFIHLIYPGDLSWEGLWGCTLGPAEKRSCLISDVCPVPGGLVACHTFITLVLGREQPGFKFWLHHWLVLRPCPCYLTL